MMAQMQKERITNNSTNKGSNYKNEISEIV